ncbi:MAG: hypothetical protein ACTSVW_04755 [Candidatus Njordarchaeales archaeon]
MEVSFSEREQKLFTLLLTFQNIKNWLKSKEISKKDLAVEQYNKIVSFIMSLKPEVAPIIPLRISLDDPERYGKVDVAIDQAMAFLMPELLNLYIKIFHFFSGLAPQPQLPGQLVHLMELTPILLKLKLTFNWVVSAIALCLLEILVNKKLKELGAETKGSFEDRTKRLYNIMKRKGTEIPQLMTSALYNVRNKVVHVGIEPTAEEIKMIMNHLTTLFKKLYR